MTSAAALPRLREAAAIVHAAMPPTPQIRWPLLEQQLPCAELWVKHENHTPPGACAAEIQARAGAAKAAGVDASRSAGCTPAQARQRPPAALGAPARRVEPATGRMRRCAPCPGVQPGLRAAPSLRPVAGSTRAWISAAQAPRAFKVRGGLVWFARLLAGGAPRPAGVVSATRGNHGQSVGFAARRHGVPATVFVPHGNSVEKNAAMRALGVALVERGDDFQAAREAAAAWAAERGWLMVPSFHPALVDGVASYALELFDAAGALDVVYVPIGLGSGACGVMAARDALGLATRVVGVVSAGAPAYALSLAAGRPVSHAVATELADGMACRTPEPAALELLAHGLDHVATVTDEQIERAMRWLFEATHQVAEGAGAAALAAAWAERDALVGLRVGVVLSGGNIDRWRYAAILNQELSS